MTDRDDIIRMAREAGGGTTWWPIYADTLERFFHAAYAAGAKAEREACAQLCDGLAKYGIPAVAACAAAIRARGANAT